MNDQVYNLKMNDSKTEIITYGTRKQSFKISFNNGLFTNIQAFLRDELRRVHNHAASGITSASYDQSTAEILKTVHWLPVQAIIIIKLSKLYSVFLMVQHFYAFEQCPIQLKDNIEKDEILIIECRFEIPNKN